MQALEILHWVLFSNSTNYFQSLLPLKMYVYLGLLKKQIRAEVEKRAKELLAFLGLSSRENHKPNELSGGEQQRVAVARALINNPAIILADEPSGNLDTESAENLHNLFFKLRDNLDKPLL